MKRYGQYPLQFQQFGGAAFGLPYGTATPSTGGGAPSGFGYLKLNSNRLTLNGKPLIMRNN